MAKRYYYTTAPRAYDYGCTDEVRTGIADKHGAEWRLVVIHDHRGGIFHEGQLPRYESGMHVAHEVSQVVRDGDRLSDELRYLCLPSLHELGIDPNAPASDEVWQKATEAEAARLADANRAEESWALRGFADGLAGRPVHEGRREAGDYALYYLKAYHAASCDY
jgi:hypothetical protein